MSAIHGTYTPHTASKRHHYPNRKIFQVSTTMEYIQEQRDTPLVESYNQQHIFIWVRNNLNLPSVQGQRYTKWEIRESCERIILIQ